MSLTSAVGGQPSTEGAEEAHRPHGQPPKPLRPVWREIAGRPARELPRLAASRRFRLQAAGVGALLAVGLLATLLPARTFRIAVDGGVTTVTSRSSNEVAVVEEAGIQLEPGDAVERAGDGVIVRRAVAVTLRADGTAYALRTQAPDIETALAQAGVTLGERDSVLRDGVFVARSGPVAAPPPLASLLGMTAPPAPAGLQRPTVDIEVRRAVPFSVVVNSQRLELQSSRETVATALRDVGMRVGPGDRVQPALNAELTSGLEVHVQQATQLVVTVPDGKAIVYTHAATVGEALAESAIALPAGYRVEPAEDTPLSPGLVVRVIGVSAEQVLETERVASKTIYTADPSLPYGERRVVTGGDGVLHRQYELVFEDGEVVSRVLAGEWYDPEPVDTVIYYSTADEPAIAAPAPAVGVPSLDGANVISTMRVYATWYNPASAGRSPSDPAYGRTATGVPVDRGIVAVDPSVIPLGTRLYIPGYGYAVAADTGGGIRGQMIDLGYPDGVVPDWTTRWVDIYILG